MPLHALDHVNVHTTDLRKMVDWYSNVLGLTSGFRPDFGIPGAWLHLGGAAVVHLIATAHVDSVECPPLEHFAFSATGLRLFLDHMSATDTPVSLSKVPEAQLIQVNIRDCDGNHIHVDFPLSEAEALTP